MKKFAYLMAAFLVAMTGCQKEPQAQSNESAEGNDVYVAFTIQAIDTKSATNTADGSNYGSSDADPNIEIGLDVENTITNVDIVLRNGPTYVSATASANTEENAGVDNATYPKKYVAKFNSSLLKTNTDYDIYVYANCSAKQDLNATSSASIDAMTDDNKFWMTNAYAQTTKFTSFSTDINNPTVLGDVYVERAMARFDYKHNADGYEVGEDITITLTKAALINQSKNFYLIRRVSDDGTADSWTVGGVETKINYVVDTDYEAKKDGYQAEDVDNFDFPLSNVNSWEFEDITSLETADNWKKDSGFKIWKYAKENTIPRVENQVNGLSTGIVFKGKLSGSIIDAAAVNKEPIYVFNNILYGTWSDVKEAAAQIDAPEALKYAVTACSEDNGSAKATSVLASAGFTSYVYEDAEGDTDDGYYAYYYYWNRHNDNGLPTQMGKMEFAVVRNNVYKLCVDSISKFGHPGPGGSDPDPVDPSDPDEQGEYYFSVSVKVVPWVVRVNHIGW